MRGMMVVIVKTNAKFEYRATAIFGSGARICVLKFFMPLAH
jgi:hypothetical protein